ncbi:glutaredoxin 2 [Acetobacter malorum DSM 14337]|uniref:Glutaredoxin 2 n=1 Tax=Acetobacter malorum DSM 14337 TaxID=1307910 RepID=A0ABQ0PVY0_9PROT|nr:glutaredoxin 2 [Acetobacter malorum]KXV07550.1 glutaredoxin [Acetobacter malorum]GBQ82949.1 glutaredoxin 2 [Acetobacter malorum DSM 14337]
MKLYIYEHCPFCSRARMMAGLKNIPVELCVVMEGDSETPLRLTGKKGLPILQKDDGTCMPESLDIVHYLDDTYPPRLLTSPANEALMVWSKQTWSLGLKLIVPRFTRGKFAEVATDAARQAFIAREEQHFGNLDALMAQTETLLPPVQAQLDKLEPLLASPPVLTEADFHLYPVLRSLSIVKGLNFGPNTLRYMQDMAQKSRVPLLADQAQ